MSARLHGKALSLSYYAIVILKAHFAADVFHEVTGITDTLERNAHDQNEQTITKIYQTILYLLNN